MMTNGGRHNIHSWRNDPSKSYQRSPLLSLPPTKGEIIKKYKLVKDKTEFSHGGSWSDKPPLFNDQSKASGVNKWSSVINLYIAKTKHASKWGKTEVSNHMITCRVYKVSDYVKCTIWLAKYIIAQPYTIQTGHKEYSM